MENQVIEPCLLCYSDTVVLEASNEHIRGLKTINNLFDVLGIPMKFFYELWPVVTPQFEINLTFCQHCNSLIDQGLNLKNQLGALKSNLLETARGVAVNKHKDIPCIIEETDTAPPESRVFRHSFRKLLLDGDAGGLPHEISGSGNTTKKSVSEDSGGLNDEMDRSSPVVFPNEDSRASLDDENAGFGDTLPLDVQIRELPPDRNPSPMSLVGFDFFANLNVSRDIFALADDHASNNKNNAAANRLSSEKLKQKTRGKQCNSKDATVSYSIPSQLKDGKAPVRRNPKRQKMILQATPLDYEDPASDEMETITHVRKPRPYIGLSQPVSIPPKKYICLSCPIAFSSEAVLEIHTQEMHAEKDDMKVIFKCPICDGELIANKFFLPENRYSTMVDGEVKYFDQFFQLCDNHFEKCSRAQPNRKLGTTKKAPAQTASVSSVVPKITRPRGRPRTRHIASCAPGVAELKKRKRRGRRKKSDLINNEPNQIYLYRRLDPISKCMLCKAFYAFSTLPRHYQYSHGLTCCSEDRFSCDDCNEIYKAKDPNIKLGKVAPTDLEHFKDFAKLHSLCDRPKLTEFRCADCKSLEPFTTPREFFFHDIEFHTHDEKFKCGICGDSFLRLPFLSRHVKHAHRGTFKFVCGMCPDSFISVNDYYEHMRSSHVKNNLFVCFICDHEEPNKWRYNSHMHEKHGLRNVHAPAKNAVAQKPTPQHKSAFRAVKPFPCSNIHAKCFICDRMFHGPELLDLHLRELHEPTTNAADLSFKCACGKEFQKSDYLVQVPDDDPEYKYPKTINLSGDEEIISSFSQYCNVHALICPQWTESAKLPRSSSYNCVKCKKSFDSPNEYVLHLQSYYLHLLANCHLCEFATHDSGKLDSHYYRLHNIKQVQCTDYYYCRFCRTCFDGGRPEVETGKLIKEDVEKFKEFAILHSSCQKRQLDRKLHYNCKFCGKTVRTKFNHSPMELFKHEVEEHTRNFLRYCDICAAGYFTLTEFNYHVKSHNKRFKCDICSAAFRCNMVLEDHMRAHKNDRAFVCHICGKSFWSKTRLRDHERTHREEKDWPCTICGKMFKSPRYVRSHQYIVHKKRRDTTAFLNRRSNISVLKPQESESHPDA